MNEEWSPEVLIEYLLDSFCWQWWMSAKKRRSQQNHISYFISPTSDFSRAHLLIGKWWVFIVQLNWMKSDTFRWGLINWGYLEMYMSASLKHLQLKIKKFETWRQTHPRSGMCLLFIVNSVWPCTRQRVCFKDVTPNFSKKDMLQMLSRCCVKYFLCSLKEKWLYCAYLCMTSSRTDVCQFHPSLHWHTEMAWYMEDLRPL